MKLKIIILFLLIFSGQIFSQAPTTLNDFFMPGSQPLQSGTIDTEAGCNCHVGFNINTEPGFAWMGSMMGNSARDPLYLATQSIANQDAPESGDLCIRCHYPKGWLEGRSTPTNGSALTADDRHGIVCHFCHKAVTPTRIGVNPYPSDAEYTSGTYTADQAYISSLTDTTSFIANGMYIIDNNDVRRGPYNSSEISPPHSFYYSPFTKESGICGTCHDVSNPVFERDSNGNYAPNSFDAPADSFNPYDMFPVERTYSEWKVSAYNTPEGVYAPQFGGNIDIVRTCQDCHMRDITGKGAKTGGAATHDDLGFHDFTGGNTFVPTIINQTFPADAVDPIALDSSIARATYMLQNATSMTLDSYVDGSNHELTVTLTNETGHKLPSGYPEGRRIWLNVQAFDSGDNLIYESGAYDNTTAVLTHDTDLKIYQIKPGISNSLATTLGMTAGPSFHFVLNDTIYSDNRIPPRGFTNAAFDSIQSPPVAYTYADGQYWDDTEYLLPGATAKVKVALYYQTTSKEYVEFLRDENVTDTWGDTVYSLWLNNGKSAPVIMNLDSLSLTPLAGNSPPVLAAIGSKTVDENGLLTFIVTATDNEDPSPALTTSTLPGGASFIDNDDGTGTFSWTPDFTQSGIYNITFTATDDSSATDSEEITITVNNVNQPPILTAIGNKSTDEGVILAFGVSATDPDGSTPVLTTSTLPDGASFTNNGDGSGIFSWTPDFTQSGNYNITFIATDDSSATDSEEITITVNNVNENNAPILAAIGNKTVDENSLLTFIVTATDNEDPSPALTTSTLPGGASFIDNDDGTGTFSWTPDFSQGGDYNITFTATDDSSATDSEEITITVNNINRPPVIDPVDDTIAVPLILLEVAITATDPDGDLLSFSMNDNTGTGAFITDHGDNSATVSWTPEDWQASTDEFVSIYSFQIIATDLSSAGDTISYTVYVDMLGSCCIGIRGNIDNDPDDIIDIADLVYMVDYQFRGGDAPECLDEADLVVDEIIDIADLVFMVDYQFRGGDEPPPCQ